MQDPLKQGLKLLATSASIYLVSDSNARSTKTRIETYMLGQIEYHFGYSNARSTKTRIETYDRARMPV